MFSNFTVFVLFLITVLPQNLNGITTVHHDKPEESTISKTANVPSVERHKRLLPYVNYYSRSTRKPTPFLESNALPGRFTPIIKHPVNEESPNYAFIYDTLMHLKQAQQAMRHNYYQKPQIRFIPLPPPKTVLETYTPRTINLDYKIYKPPVIERPLQTYRPAFAKVPRKPVFYYEKPQAYPTPPTQVNTIVDEKYVAQKLVEPSYGPVQFITEKPNFIEYYTESPQVTTENTNILAKILKQLQNSNALPQTFTPQNIDNSIRTLVKILNNMAKEQGLKAKPIVVVDEEEEQEEEEDITDKPSYAPETYTQIFPANTIDGGTPGRPGIDYPALSTIPQTDFNCKTQRYKGFFGDPHTNCQVWHYCDLNGGQASFLCPNGTIFSQVALTCDWWYNVKCASTPQLYVLNERLYKYIIPLAPKFPEDYSGPLVDRYLALKFQEMEEKMKNNKKKEESSEEEKDDSDQLQDIQNEKNKLEK